MRNKKQFSLTAICGALMLLLAFSVALASHGEEGGDATGQRPGSRKPEAMAQATSCENLTGDALARCQAASTNMEHARANRISGLKKLMTAQISRSENALKRFEVILTRVEEARTQLAGRGGDLADADTMIASAKAKMAAAEQALDEARGNLEALPTTETPKRSVQAFMSSMKTLKTSLIEVQRTLKGAVKEMKEANKALKAAGSEEEGEEPETEN